MSQKKIYKIQSLNILEQGVLPIGSSKSGRKEIEAYDNSVKAFKETISYLSYFMSSMQVPLQT